MRESDYQRLALLTPVVYLFVLDRRKVAKRLQQPPVVEPVYPVQRRELDLLDAPPRPRSRMTSALNSPMIVSAIALS